MYTFGLEQILLKWLVAERPHERPELRGGETIYPRKKRVRVAGAVFGYPWLAYAGYCAWDGRMDFTDGVVIGLVLFFASIGLLGISAASGEVVVDSSGVTKRVLGIPRSLVWQEITDVRWMGVAYGVEIRAGWRKMTVDNTFIATAELYRDLSSRSMQRA